MKLIASEDIIYRSPYPEDVFCYSPSLEVIRPGKLLASFDLGGPGIDRIGGPKTSHGDFGLSNQCKVYYSADNGVTWTHRADLAMFHVRFFHDGNAVYLIGHDRRITISVSYDEGITWSGIRELNDSGLWHQAPCAVHYDRDFIYLTMEKSIGDLWPDVSPLVMRGRRGTDLTRRENWTFSNLLEYPFSAPTTIGVPLHEIGPVTPPPSSKYYYRPCFLESHVVKIHDPDHILYGENKVHIWMRQHSGLANIAAIAECETMPDGSLKLDFVKTGGGAMMLHVPFPGGHMKFHVVYDEVGSLYWLVCTQSADSMTRPERLSADRFGLGDNERYRLALYFSKNMFDWCFAGMAAIGKSQKCSRHYASMVISGDDLLILSRSGDENAASAHNGNMITLHRVENFRDLVY